MTDERGRILALLPEAADEDTAIQLRDAAEPDLGGGILLYKRESWSESWDEEIGFAEEDAQKPRWAARCKCSECGESWHSGWSANGRIQILIGEDGNTYTGMPGDGDYRAEIDEGEHADCPFCGEKLTAAKTKSLGRGRTYQVLVGQLVNLGRYSTMLYWLVSRRVNHQADSTYGVSPWAAVTIGESGRIYRFTHADMANFGRRTPGREWREQPRMGEPISQRYYSWGCVNSTCVGGLYITGAPEVEGMTGEKTGIAAYIEGGGSFPLTYLLRQRQKKALEALALEGWVFTIDSAITEEIHGTRQAWSCLKQTFDLTKRKPKDMVGMNRTDARRYAKNCWTWNRLAAYRGSGLMPDDFSRIANRNGIETTRKAAERLGAERLLKVDRYLERQNEVTGLRLYLDYLEAHLENGGGETQAELYPPHLRRAHDRATAARRIAADRKKDAEFQAVREKWAALEWSDGEICAVLPGSQTDLTEEGKTLHHCVGGYGEQHLSGNLIVFIRHARRPERSWFTLNISTGGTTWNEVQLHGYGNEYAHGKRLHIPQAVRDFVNRWETEILEPTFRAVKQAEKKRKTKKEEHAA